MNKSLLLAALLALQPMLIGSQDVAPKPKTISQRIAKHAKAICGIIGCSILGYIWYSWNKPAQQQRQRTVQDEINSKKQQIAAHKKRIEELSKKCRAESGLKQDYLERRNLQQEAKKLEHEIAALERPNKQSKNSERDEKVSKGNGNASANAQENQEHRTEPAAASEETREQRITKLQTELIPWHEKSIQNLENYPPSNDEERSECQHQINATIELLNVYREELRELQGNSAAQDEKASANNQHAKDNDANEFARLEAEAAERQRINEIHRQRAITDLLEQDRNAAQQAPQNTAPAGNQPTPAAAALIDEKAIKDQIAALEDLISIHERALHDERYELNNMPLYGEGTGKRKSELRRDIDINEKALSNYRTELFDLQARLAIPTPTVQATVQPNNRNDASSDEKTTPITTRVSVEEYNENIASLQSTIDHYKPQIGHLQAALIRATARDKGIIQADIDALTSTINDCREQIKKFQNDLAQATPSSNG